MQVSILRILLYQTARVFVNGLRRAFGNPVRALLTIVVVGFIVCAWGLALVGSLLEPPRSENLPNLLQPERIAARSLVIVLIVHWFYVVFTVVPSVFRPPQILIQESDVHYLFTTPLKPLTLFRGIILIRGLLGAFFLMVILVLYWLLFGGANLRLLMATQEQTVSAWAIGVYPLLYLLVFTTSILGSVAIEAMELEGRARRRVWAWILIGWAVVSVLLVGVRSWQLSGSSRSLTMELVAQALDWTPAYVWLLPVRGLADAALVLYSGFTPAIGFSVAFWLLSVWWGNAMLARYQARLYEVGASLARKGAQARAVQRDPYRVFLERKAARAASKPVRTLRWLERWTPRGSLALVWRDLLITWRASGWGNLILIGILAILPPALMLLIQTIANPERDLRFALRMVYVLAQSLAVFFIAFGAYYGMTDMLRRVEWQKPLPFAPHTVVLVESLPTVVLFAVSQVLSVLFASLLASYDWLFWLGSSLVAISWAIVLQMAMIWIALVNPDPTDYTQRLLTGVLMVPALFLSGAPGLGVWVLGVLFEWNLWLAAGFAFGANLFVSMVLTAINSELYERFSPVD
ncbi:MAG: putative ABC exporter domain-containing protein [Fimbriimonadales bacterium]